VCRDDQQGESTSEEANERFLNALVPDVSTAEIPESATNILVFRSREEKRRRKRAARKTRLYNTQAKDATREKVQLSQQVKIDGQ